MYANHYSGAPENSSQQQQQQQQQHHHHQQHHGGLAHERSGAVPVRQQVPPLPHLHMVMSQSGATLPAPGSSPAYQFGVGNSNRSDRDTIGVDSGAYSNRSAPIYNGERGTYVYPSTLFPSRHIQAHQQESSSQTPEHAPVKLLQSCDSCRRRKIRCSGEKPTCSACTRYQEKCHYSPLATPRRRVGKRIKMNAEYMPVSMSINVSKAYGERSRGGNGVGGSGVAMPINVSASVLDSTLSLVPAFAPVSSSALVSASATVAMASVAPSGIMHSSAYTSSVVDHGEESETGRMRRDIKGLSRKFDILSDKLDMLMDLVGKRQCSRTGGNPESELDLDINMGSTSDEDDGSYEGGEQTQDDQLGDAEEESHEFSTRIDKTSRFGIDATNIGMISGMISDMNERLGTQRQDVRQPVEGVHVSTGLDKPEEVPTETPQCLALLESPEIKQHLLDMFFLNAGITTVSLIPRYIFSRLQAENRVPISLTNIMMADACNYSDLPALMTAGRTLARGYFIERAYKGLFDCLEYDSVEHCVALVLFSIIITKAGLHRAWVMHSLGMQMAIRLRFNTIDSPLSALTFKKDSELIREWKRRVFWQLYTFDILTSSMSDLQPSLRYADVRCNVPVPLPSREMQGPQLDPGHYLTLLGPTVVFCDDQQTIAEQVELIGIMCDITSLQTQLTPEVSPFPPAFKQIFEHIVALEAHIPHIAILVEGDPAQISKVFEHQPGRFIFGLLLQYTRIFLCLIKDTWLPTARAMTAEEKNTLNWARQTAYESAQVVHRVVPFLREMQQNTVCSYVSCIVFQACIVSLNSCSWWPSQDDPHSVQEAVSSVQNGMDFFEYVAPRLGFSRILTTSLRSLMAECGFENKINPSQTPPESIASSFSGRDSRGKDADTRTATPPGAGPQSMPSSDIAERSSPSERMRMGRGESHWESMLRINEIPSLLRTATDNSARLSHASGSSEMVPSTATSPSSSQRPMSSAGSDARTSNIPVLDHAHERALQNQNQNQSQNLYQYHQQQRHYPN
ncbi:hypothetical protein LPJ66_002703 [Kickxella alabastrina]|uniref:Uncharacterized protein n=1 Tax=Kickxella alabastrina TaxID=61397 RepID=A0ACC1IPS7_9FUNG|nr:hypothetical protein LPJ66_002703 [Kickxella alabastrina]